MGWLVKLNGEKVTTKPRPGADEHLTVAECAVMQKKLVSAVDKFRLSELSASLGVRSLKCFEIGYSHERRAWTFPMRDGKRRIIGFRTRGADGEKRCVTGSRNGLFIPIGLDLVKGYDLPFDTGDRVELPPVLLLPEGPTDAAAALDLGFRAIGRPSNMGGADMLRELLADAPERVEVVIMADHDRAKFLKDGTPFVPGWEGALHLAWTILPVCGTLKICRPPGEIKDLRDWMVKGGEAVVLKSLIEDTQTVTRKLLDEKRAKLDAWKKAIRAQRDSIGHGSAGRESCVAEAGSPCTEAILNPGATLIPQPDSKLPACGEAEKKITEPSNPSPCKRPPMMSVLG